MLGIRSAAVYAIAVITVLGVSLGAKADWTMMVAQVMTAGTGCSLVLLAK
jgi:hypothetical protein